MFELDELTVE